MRPPKLSSEQLVALRIMWIDPDCSVREIAQKFGIDQTSVGRIAREKHFPPRGKPKSRALAGIGNGTRRGDADKTIHPDRLKYGTGDALRAGNPISIGAIGLTMEGKIPC